MMQGCYRASPHHHDTAHRRMCRGPPLPGCCCISLWPAACCTAAGRDDDNHDHVHMRVHHPPPSLPSSTLQAAACRNVRAGKGTGERRAHTGTSIGRPCHRHRRAMALPCMRMHCAPCCCTHRLGTWSAATCVHAAAMQPPPPAPGAQHISTPQRPPPIGPQQVAAELQGRVDALASELERANPNMRATEQYEHVKEKEREQVGRRMRRRPVHGHRSTSMSRHRV